MGAKADLIASTEDELDEIAEQLETLSSKISEIANTMQGGFDRNDRVNALAGDMHFTAGELNGEFRTAAHNWRSELAELKEALAAAGE